MQAETGIREGRGVPVRIVDKQGESMPGDKSKQEQTQPSV
jgi:hypothetical protein